MTDSLTQITRDRERRDFVASALAAREEVARSGRVMEAVDVHKWLLARAEGGNPALPRARKLVK